MGTDPLPVAIMIMISTHITNLFDLAVFVHRSSLEQLELVDAPIDDATVLAVFDAPSVTVVLRVSARLEHCVRIVVTHHNINFHHYLLGFEPLLSSIILNLVTVPKKLLPAHIEIDVGDDGLGFENDAVVVLRHVHQFQLLRKVGDVVT